MSVIRQRQRPGGENPVHTHDREEGMIVVTGTITFTVAGEAVAPGPGDTVIIPPQTPRRVQNTGDLPAEWYLVAPAGVRFFHANSDEAAPPWAW